MNVRKPVDYSEMYAAIDSLMARALSQMTLYCGIGKAVSSRTEKGAAVAAAEYLQANYPTAVGFSPRNLRRMRDFCRAYESNPALMALAMELCWTLNAVILEAELSAEERSWYLRACKQFGWSKLELQRQINASAHMSIILDSDETEEDGGGDHCDCNADSHGYASISQIIVSTCGDLRNLPKILGRQRIFLYCDAPPLDFSLDRRCTLCYTM